MDRTDYRRTSVSRRRTWFGLKRHVKRMLSWTVPHLILRALVRLVPAWRADGRLPAPARLKEVRGRVDDAQFVMLRPDRCVVAKELYWGKGRRPRPEDNLAIELFAALAREADVVLDIGAYTGIFTLVGTAVNAHLEAHAFEIVPDVYRALFDNCVRNDVLHRTTLHHVGLGVPGTSMRVPAGSGDSALPSFYSSRLHFETGPVIRFSSLDSVARTLPSASRVVVKIDVEGSENQVLEHGQWFLTSFKPDVLCEVLKGVGQPRELERLLQDRSYRFYLIRESDLLPTFQLEPSELYRDWLFTTREPAQLRHLGIPVSASNDVTAR